MIVYMKMKGYFKFEQLKYVSSEAKPQPVSPMNIIKKEIELLIELCKKKSFPKFWQ